MFRKFKNRLAGSIRSINSRFESAANPDLRSIYVDYFPNASPRYGYSRPPLSRLAKSFDDSRNDYMVLLKSFAKYSNKLSEIPKIKPSNDELPYWGNPWFGGTNAIALYCMPALLNAKQFIEIGSGNSTKFMRRSIKDNNLGTVMTSIDPFPRAEIDNLCDEIYRIRLEDADLTIFNKLAKGDIVVFDGSHRCFTNSDVTVFFLEILPELALGVVVYIDDIYLPYDYPEVWGDRYYSEQYLLAGVLIADRGSRYKVILPHVYIEKDKELSIEERNLWAAVGYNGSSGNGIWLEIC